jgi:hypothetical protein
MARRQAMARAAIRCRANWLPAVTFAGLYVIAFLKWNLNTGR